MEFKSVEPFGSNSATLHTAERERQRLDCVDRHLSVACDGLSDVAGLLTAGRHV